MFYEGFSLRDIPRWCAGCKISDVTEDSIDDLNLKDMIISAIKDSGFSVITISVNESETKVIEWLKNNKFKRGPVCRNYGHGGRKTYLYFYQISKKDWKKYGGDEFF